jgi:hypothetical protein
MKSMDSGSNRPAVLWLVGASSGVDYCLAAAGWVVVAGRNSSNPQSACGSVPSGPPRASETTVIGGEVLAEIAQVEKWINAVGIDDPGGRSFPGKTHKNSVF